MFSSEMRRNVCNSQKASRINQEVRHTLHVKERSESKKANG